MQVLPKLHTVAEFPALFASGRHANVMKVGYWWKKRDTIMALKTKVVTRYSGGVRKILHMKTSSGKGPETQPWVQWLAPRLEAEFRRLQKAGVPMSCVLILDIAKALVLTRQHPEFNKDFRTAPRKGQVEGMLIIDVLNYNWVDNFLRKKEIILRAVTG